MHTKKETSEKYVHKFTQIAMMKFRPQHYNEPIQKQENVKPTLLDSVSSILGGFFKKGQASPKKNNNSQVNKTYQKSSSGSSIQALRNKSQIINNSRRSAYSALNTTLTKNSPRSQLTFLQKVSPQAFLIGNENQLDLISFIGIYDSNIDTDLNWSLSLGKAIKKIALESKKMMIALEIDTEIHLYKYDLRKIKYVPVYLSKVRTQGEFKFLLFLKDNLFGIFYTDHLQIFQIEDTLIRQIFNKSYGVQQSLQLFQVPKPIQSVLNIFFKQASKTARLHTLWRLELQLKNISSSNTFKSLMRIYDIPNALMKRFRIDNYSKDTFIMNFQHEIYAAKDGYIVDNVNINIQSDQSCLIYSGDHLLAISDQKLDLYSFKIITNVKPSRIALHSVDSVVIKKDKQYYFFDCLQMLNGNFVLFFQIKPEYNKKTKGQIDYLITVTQKLTIAQKLSQIFTFKSARELRKIAKRNYELIEEKCDIAFKFGLTRKQVYLELWMRSAKSTISDYKFLLDTMDYETIKQEIQKKLKKSSMQFRQVYKLEQSCFQMLKKQLFSPAVCSQQCIKHYLKSHFLLRKLQFYRDIQALQREDICDEFQDQKGKEKSHRDDKKKGEESEDSEEMQQRKQVKSLILHIDIQQYFNCINMELKSYFLQLASDICHNQKFVVQKLRLFIRKFKFPLRIIYLTLLQNLIIHSKSKLIIFMKAFPQILPYQYIDLPQNEDRSMFRGLFEPISAEEWTKNLHIEEISTIYNREAVDEITKIIWFKRNQYTLHDLIALNKQKINEIVQFNNSDAIFYFFIQKIFEHCKAKPNQEQIIFYLQQNYDKLPQHLKGRIFLYRELYNYFITERYNSPNISNFNTFLKMQDYEVFRQLFRYQKIKKGCLLKDAKNIFSSFIDGNQIYKQSLLRYFSSGHSQISDLKCILNRLNNEKLQFHTENEGIYEVLVKAMQIKVKLGTDNDIPLQEVMIYIDNIPLNKDSPVIEQLRVVQRINQQAQLFKQMKINLSFLEIMEREQFVVSQLLNFFINQQSLMSTQNPKQFTSKTYDILAKVQIAKDQIYKKENFKDLQYFLYLNKLLEHQQMIKYAKMILQNPYIQAEYNADQIILQNLVLYMVKWRLEERSYREHQDYIYQLLTILPEDNPIRNYIQAQTEFAILLSTPESPVLYPLTSTTSTQVNEVITIRLSEIQNLFKKLNKDFLISLDLDHLYELIKQMQRFYEEEIIKIQDIYEIAVKRLLEIGEVKQAIPLFKKAYSLRGTSQNYSIVFCFLILDKIIVDLPENHRKNFIKLVFYTFSQPLQLIQIIQSRINSKFSNEEEDQFMAAQLERVNKNKCYSPDSVLLDKLFLAKVKERQDKHNSQFQQLIFQTWTRVCSNRDDFNRSLDYTWIFIMLIQNPYAISKYISVKGEELNIRIVRSFLSYVYRQQIFNGLNILKFARRAFTISLEQIYTQLTIEYIASQYKGVDLQDEQQIEIEDTLGTPFESKLIKSIKTFTKKMKSIKSKPAQAQDEQKKKKRVIALLTSQLSIDLGQSQYPFSDSDDNYECQKQELSNIKVISPNKPKKKGGQKKLLREKQKNLALFLTNIGGSGNQQQIRKTSPRLRTSLAFHNHFQSVHFLKSKKIRKQSDNDNNHHFNLGQIVRTESIGMAIGDDQLLIEQRKHQMSKSQNYKPQIKDDYLFISIQQNSLRPKSNSNNLRIMTKSDSPNISAEQVRSEIHSPLKLRASESLVNMDISEEFIKQPSSEQIEEVKYENNQQYGFNFTVNVQQINDEIYTAPEKLVKQMVQDHGDNEIDPMFDLNLIIAQKEKEFGEFEGYLKKLVIAAYDMRSKSLSLMLQLIKQIQLNFPQAKIQSDFLKVYIALESYNTKYKYNLPIRQMFPIGGIFLQSTDLKSLFHYVKEKILQFVDFGHIFVVAKVIHFSFQKSDIKDQLYYSYLLQAVTQYGSDSLSSQEELMMQKERIGGIVQQIILLNILVQRGKELLGSIEIPARRQDIEKVIKDVFLKKKKASLIAEFEKIPK